jgi:hypothetical protein
MHAALANILGSLVVIIALGIAYILGYWHAIKDTTQ